MKTNTFVTIILFFLLSIETNFAQDSLKLGPTGFNEVAFNSVNIDNITYTRAITWVNATYKNPNAVLVGNVINESLTISGFMDKAWHYKSMGMEFYYNMSYKIYVQIKDGLVNFKFVDEKHTLSGGTANVIPAKDFYNKQGEYKDAYNSAKTSLENTVNALYFSFKEKIQSSTLSSAEAIEELKKWKEKFDLGLISEEEYNKKKEELSQFIK